jgi:hypothetical protein
MNGGFVDTGLDGPVCSILPTRRHFVEPMSDSTLRPATEVLARRLPGGAVLVHLTTNRIFEVNETGAVVWELLVEGLSRDDLLTRLIETFAVDRDQAAADLDRIVAELQAEGLLNLP